jgi:hypothetical protein
MTSLLVLGQYRDATECAVACQEAHIHVPNKLHICATEVPALDTRSMYAGSGMVTGTLTDASDPMVNFLGHHTGINCCYPLMRVSQI